MWQNYNIFLDLDHLVYFVCHITFREIRVSHVPLFLDQNRSFGRQRVVRLGTTHPVMNVKIYFLLFARRAHKAKKKVNTCVQVFRLTVDFTSDPNIFFKDI